MSDLKDASVTSEGNRLPAEVEQVDVDKLYAVLADRGLHYGPAFRGLRQAWRDGKEIGGVVELPDALSQRDYLVHPAALDAALHAAMVPFLDESDDKTVYLPFAWRGVKLHGGGAGPLHVQVRPDGPNAVSLSLTDQAGRLVATVDSLVVRPVSVDQLSQAEGQLLRVTWQLVRGAGPASGERPVLLGTDFAGLDPAANPGRLHTDYPTLRSFGAALSTGRAPRTTLVGVDNSAPVSSALQRALVLIQEFLAENRLADGRLVFLTRGGVSADAAEPAPGLAAAAVWGLIRAAQHEHPNRFALIDLAKDWTWQGLESALASGGAQLAVRGRAVFRPRLLPAKRSASQAEAWPTDRSVLITGGLGALGRLVAEHVAGLGVRQLVLVGRRGLDTPGAVPFVARLAELGCRAVVIAGDITDPDTLRRALAAVPAEYPLGTVVHSAGSTADGLVTSLTPRRVDSVLGAKLAAAEVLDQLTMADPQVRLVLFSSLAGVLGNAGQANYAAANAALDALAQRSRAAGRLVVSLAWGPWQDGDGLASELSTADRARMLRSGVAPLPAEHGLKLLDAALVSEEAVLVPVRLDQEALRSGSAPLPELLLELAPQRSRSTATADEAEQFRNRLATLSLAEQEAAVLELVRREVAIVLGHHSSDSVDPHEPFPNLGFDSLTNLELARRLSAATAVRLSNTLAFDFPTTVELTSRLTSLLT